MMKRLQPFFVTLLLLLAVSAGLCLTAYAEGTGVIYAYDVNGAGPGGGWKEQEDGNWKYQKNGTDIVNAWEEIDGKWYRFGEDGRMLKGWQDIGGDLYYLTETADEAHPEGSCYISEATPDGCRVDETGKRVFNPVTDTLTMGIVRANPYGDQTCVEVVLSEQTIYVYRGTELVLASPCVTGSVYGGHATPSGNYRIYSKERNRTLRGTNNDGSKYASFVNFWMPFNGGIGLHDAPWRGSFGGDIYLWGGSHGCVNMPYDRAAALFEIAYVGMPVHVHN